MKDTVYLVDGSAYIYRAYHAIRPLTSRSGVPTNATLGFINMVNRLKKEKNPAYLAIAFDSRGPVFRHQMYTDYKANRPPMPEDLQVQIPYIKRFVAAARILSLEQEGVEADDILASVTRHFTDLGHPVIIVSGDKDLLQLVGDQVTMWDPMQDRLMDSNAIGSKYGVGPERLLDLFALIGDSSDNVPGVPGVGIKTAEKLMTQYQGLDDLYERLATMKKSKLKERLLENRDMAFLSRELIRLKTDVAIPSETTQYQYRSGDDHALAELYQELDFASLLKTVDTGEELDHSRFHTVRTHEELAAMVAELQGAREIVIDTETTSLEARTAQLVGVSICSTLEKAWYLPVNHRDEEGKRRVDQLSPTEVKEALTPFLCSPEVTVIGHNLKYDLTVLAQQWELRPTARLADTMIAAYLTESGSGSLKLDSLCLERGLRLTGYAEVVGKDLAEKNFASVAIADATNYSCEDVYGALVLWQEFSLLLQKLDLDELFYAVEMAILPLLVDMEIAGICLDTRVLDELAEEFGQQLETYEKEIYQLAGHEFNINSPQQLGRVLFEELELPHGRKTKTGYSTDMRVLERLASRHDLPARVLRYRTLAKLQSTYVVKLRQLRDDKSGRVHTSYNQAVTATGRLSSSDPNLQNIPIRTAEGNRIRAAFVPGKDLIFLSADYSQIDLRVLAHYSQDEALLQAFRLGEDIHARTAAEIFGISSLLVTSEMRRVAKSINFGIVYGMSAFGLASQLDISRKEAQRFIDRYFGLYTGVKRFMEEIVDTARKQGYVTTLLNRRRTVTDIDSQNRVQREFAERMAINTPIQGTAADIIKLAMISCARAIGEQQLRARMLLQIHDELVFELPEAELPATKEIIRRAMETAYSLDVPLTVNLEVGRSLAK